MSFREYNEEPRDEIWEISLEAEEGTLFCREYNLKPGVYDALFCPSNGTLILKNEAGTKRISFTLFSWMVLILKYGILNPVRSKRGDLKKLRLVEKGSGAN